MKKSIVKNKRKITRYIAIGLSSVIVLLSAFYFVSDVQAKRNILDSLSKQYSSKPEAFNILEIVPATDGNHINEEIGYYVADQQKQNYFVGVSKAKSIKPNIASLNYNTDPFKNDWREAMVQMREYGMVKFEGLDPKYKFPSDGKFVSENPIYFTRALFIKGSIPKNEYIPLEENTSVFEQGTYTQVSANDGAYELLDGYVLKGNEIYQLVTQTVSGPSITVSGQELPGPDITLTDEQLVVVPNGSDYYEIKLDGIGIKYVGIGKGDIKFSGDRYGKYFGYSTMGYLYFLKKENNSDQSFYNGEWFKEYVLGDQTIAKTVNVTTVSAKDVKDTDIDSYDLVYISGKSQDYVTSMSDISNDVLKKLYNRVAVDHTEYKRAVIMDFASYDQVGTSNISKLAQLLWQKNQLNASVDMDPSLSTNSTRLGFGSKGEITDISQVINNNDLWNDLSKTMLTGASGNFVAGNLYVYDHKRSLFDNPKSLVDASDWFATGDFNTPMRSSVVSLGFQDVANMIEINNANNPDKQVNSSVTQAMAIQFILAYDGSGLGLIKEDLHILEIQPVRGFLYNTKNETVQYDLCTSTVRTNRLKFIENYIYGTADKAKAGAKNILFTSMTIEQFICTNDNILEKYDIIYIGDEQQADINGTNTNLYEQIMVDGKTFPNYYDDSLDGAIYYNIGDKIDVIDSSLGEGFVRYAGRDLTEEKLNALKVYLDNNNPIIVGSELMKTNSNTKLKVINPTMDGSDKGRIDNSSKLYELFQYGILKDNFVSEAEVGTGAEKYMSLVDFEKYYNNPKLSLFLTEQPNSYKYSTKKVNTVEDVIAAQEELKTKEVINNVDRYYLQYEFNFSNLSLQSAASGYYARLFIDVNADGRFAESEELVDCIITNEVTGVEPPFIGGNVQRYLLSPNVSYRLKREVPDGYAGVLPWSLKIESIDNSAVFVTKKGFTVVPADKKKIRILQINEETIKNGKLVQTLNLEEEWEKGDNSLYGTYLKNLQDFDLEITTEYESNYVNNVRKDWTTAEQFLLTPIAGYDMIVLGFSDDYQLLSGDNEKKVVNDIKQYIKTGKPVLFSHDTIMFYPNRDTAKTLRMPSGQDRYGVTDASILGERIAYQPNSNKKTVLTQTQGYSNLTIWRYISGRAANITEPKKKEKEDLTLNSAGVKYNRPLFIWAENILAFSTNYTDNGNGADNYFVENINKGQITTYPYTLPDKFAVANTHGQYFQLNMEQDDDFDGQGDVVVWYTLGDTTGDKVSKYSINPGDGVNNYYIYNMGNVTYTGAGHSSIGGTSAQKYEAQLFVNTLVAAYQAANKPANVKFYETKSSIGKELTSVAVPYDSNVSKENSIEYNKVTSDYLYKFVDPNEDPKQAPYGTKGYIRVTDPNLVNGVKIVGAKFYLQIEDGAESFETSGGKVLDKTHIKKITLPSKEEVTVVELPITLYDSEFKVPIQTIGTITGNPAPQMADMYNLKSGAMYGFYLPLSYLKTQGAMNLIVESSSAVQKKSGIEYLPKGYDTLPIAKMDLLKLD